MVLYVGKLWHQPQHRSEHTSRKGDVSISNDVWVGENVTIMSGVTIGNGAVIGCAALVTKDVDDYCIVAGNLPRFVRRRFADEIIEALQELARWDLHTEDIKRIIPHLQSSPNLETINEIIYRFKDSSCLENTLHCTSTFNLTPP